MRSNPWKHAMMIVGFTVLAAAPGGARAADPDWKAVEQALGKSGQLQAGDVFRIGMPRTDLSVTVKGVPVKPGFALGSYAAFKQVGDQAMVMGDLVLLDQEVPAVMAGLFSGATNVRFSLAVVMSWSAPSREYGRGRWFRRHGHDRRSGSWRSRCGCRSRMAPRARARRSRRG